MRTQDIFIESYMEIIMQANYRDELYRKRPDCKDMLDRYFSLRKRYKDCRNEAIRNSLGIVENNPETYVDLMKVSRTGDVDKIQAALDRYDSLQNKDTKTHFQKRQVEQNQERKRFYDEKVSDYDITESVMGDGYDGNYRIFSVPGYHVARYLAWDYMNIGSNTADWCLSQPSQGKGEGWFHSYAKPNVFIVVLIRVKNTDLSRKIPCNKYCMSFQETEEGVNCRIGEGYFQNSNNEFITDPEQHETEENIQALNAIIENCEAYFTRSLEFEFERKYEQIRKSYSGEHSQALLYNIYETCPIGFQNQFMEDFREGICKLDDLLLSEFLKSTDDRWKPQFLQGFKDRISEIVSCKAIKRMTGEFKEEQRTRFLNLVHDGISGMSDVDFGQFCLNRVTLGIEFIREFRERIGKFPALALKNLYCYRITNWEDQLEFIGMFKDTIANFEDDVFFSFFTYARDRP